MSILSAVPWLVPLAALALSFALSLSVALLYVRLHHGAPDTRPFAQSLAVAGVVSAIVVLSIGDSIARGIGLVGALTVIRFRSELKDPRDLIFAFAALATGVSTGSHAWAVAIGGTATFLAATTLVSRPWFAPITTFDAVLSLRVPSDPVHQEAVAETLRHYCDSFSLLRVRQGSPSMQEHAYQVRLKHNRNREALVEAMRGTARVEDALLVTLDAPQGMVASR